MASLDTLGRRRRAVGVLVIGVLLKVSVPVGIALVAKGEVPVVNFENNCA